MSEAVVPRTSKFIGKTPAELHLRKSHGISLLAINRDKDVLRENARNVPLRAGDMLVLHSIWQDLAQTAASRDFVIVTDYPKGEQRPRSEEHTSELQSLMRISYAVFCLKKK